MPTRKLIVILRPSQIFEFPKNEIYNQQYVATESRPYVQIRYDKL